jgi:hypothetical protein
MPDRVDKLRQLVKDLEAELAAIETDDAASRAGLTETLADLRTALGKLDSEPLAPDSLITRFRVAEESFQVSHPTVSGLVLRMIDALGQLGI